jgi:hypothetical protein
MIVYSDAIKWNNDQDRGTPVPGYIESGLCSSPSKKLLGRIRQGADHELEFEMNFATLDISRLHTRFTHLRQMDADCGR